MKILLYFSGRLYEPKGTPIRVQNMLSQLSHNGFDVYYSGHDQPKDFDDGHFLKLRGVFGRVFGLVSFINKNKIGVFYIQTSAGLWLAPFIRFFTRAKTGTDFHSLRIEEERIYNSYGQFSCFFRKHAELFLSRFLHFGTAVCSPLKDYYGKHVKNFIVLPVGVDTNLFNPNVSPADEVLAWKGQSVLIGYAGNTKWYQGLGVLIEALGQLKKEKPGAFKLLLIASSGADGTEQLIRGRGLSDAVFLLGKQKHQDVPKLLSAADILVIPRPSDKITEHAFPSKFPEYLALGKPVITSNVSDMADYVKDGVSGMLTRPEDVDDLCAALRKIADKDLRERMGKEGRKTAEKIFDLNVLGKNLSDYLKKI